MELPKIAGRETAEIQVQSGQGIERISSAHYYFVFFYTLKHDMSWAVKGHELANASFVLPGKGKLPKVHPEGKLHVRKDGDWVSLTDHNANGLSFITDETFDFSASHYEISDLEQAKHTIDLKPRDYVVLNLDYKQNGLGSNSCGQNQLEKYRCKFEDLTLRFRISPFNSELTTAVDLGREQC